MNINCQHSAISTISETTLGQRQITLEEKTSSINLKSKSKRLLTHCIMPENDENQDHETSQQQSDKINKIKYSNLITTGTFNQLFDNEVPITGLGVSVDMGVGVDGFIFCLKYVEGIIRQQQHSSQILSQDKQQVPMSRER
ncbi:unnamed protein product [Rotaria sordida]|uniref:Uncharacterized protein n=1 Tax=Rotaria sordida TaxID=392033 RepID=A0A815AM91_9BILA|nr:unnamed protein product [Rotaria sordida]CAF1258635.1 unnamed protein product [Rotaria sordida]